MQNIEQLSRQLTHDEYEAGRKLFNLLRERDFPINKAAGIVYRAGKLDGKKHNKEHFGKEITRLHGIINELKLCLPKAEQEKGDTINE